MDKEETTEAAKSDFSLKSFFSTSTNVGDWIEFLDS
jgi:hypothetical protein